VRELRRIAVVVNPHGGQGRAAAAWLEAREVFKARGVKADLIETEYAAHGFHIAKELDLEKIDAVVCIGGDGSLHDIVNGLLSRTEAVVDLPDGTKTVRCPVPVGIIPGGTGNSVAQAVGGADYVSTMERESGPSPIPEKESDHQGSLSATEAAEVICDGFVASCDANRLSFAPCSHTNLGRTFRRGKNEMVSVYSINMIGDGIAGVVGAFAENFRKVGGKQRYTIGILWLLLANVERRSVVTLYDTLSYPLPWKGRQSKSRFLGDVESASEDHDDDNGDSNSASNSDDTNSATGTEEEELEWAAPRDVRIDGNFLSTFSTLTPNFGVGMLPSPGAQLDDGYFDMSFIRSTARGDMLATFGDLETGSHTLSQNVKVVHARAAAVRMPGVNGVLNVDGELYPFDEEYYVQMVPGVLPLFMPHDAHLRKEEV
jgi:diacylglycerol kinase family enzyme